MDWKKYVENSEREISEAKEWLLDNKETPFSIENMIIKGIVSETERLEHYKRWAKEDGQ